MTLLFLLAVLLAIPTYGLSLLAWIAWFFLAARNNAKERINGLEHMRATRSVVEPLVGGTRSEFYQAFDIPKSDSDERSDARDSQCGQHILNFISHNPDATQAFMEALKLHRLKGSAQLAPSDRLPPELPCRRTRELRRAPFSRTRTRGRFRVASLQSRPPLLPERRIQRNAVPAAPVSDANEEISKFDGDAFRLALVRQVSDAVRMSALLTLVNVVARHLRLLVDRKVRPAV